MDAGRILFSSASRINDTALARIRKGIGKPGDILLSHKGTVGKLATAPLDCEPFVCSPQTTFWRVLDATVIDPRFLYFYMGSRSFRLQLNSIKGETDMADYASLTAQRRFHIPVVDIRLQNSIAAVLGALDDKIELNRLMNETLEAMARAIFKDWFVDFGPTRAKMDDRAPYLIADIWSLFPDRLDVDGKPEGWGWGTVDDVASLFKDTINPQMVPEGIFSHHSIPAYDSGQTPALDKGTDIKSNKTVVPQGSILLSKLNPEIPRVWLTDVGTTDRAVCSTEFLVMLAKPPAGRAFLFGLFHSSGFRESLRGMVTGTSNSHQRVKPQGVLDLEIVLPARETLAIFESINEPLIDRVITNRREVGILSALRDLLLPKLMSGELRVRDAEKMVGEAT